MLRFADDAKMISKVGTEADVFKLKNDLEKLEKWSDDWQMLFNVDKCKVMHLGFNDKSDVYSMKGNRLEPVQEERDLGVVISKDLKVSKQCVRAATKGNQILGMISRTFKSKKSVIILKLYKSLVRPHLDYCSQAWRPHLSKDKFVLEKVQRRATRMMEEFKKKIIMKD